MLNTFGGLAKSNHSIRTFIQDFLIFEYVPDTIPTVLIGQECIYRSTHVLRKSYIQLKQLYFDLALKKFQYEFEHPKHFLKEPTNLVHARNDI